MTVKQTLSHRRARGPALSGSRWRAGSGSGVRLPPSGGGIARVALWRSMLGSCAGVAASAAGQQRRPSRRRTRPARPRRRRGTRSEERERRPLRAAARRAARAAARRAARATLTLLGMQCRPRSRSRSLGMQRRRAARAVSRTPGCSTAAIALALLATVALAQLGMQRRRGRTRAVGRRAPLAGADGRDSRGIPRAHVARMRIAPILRRRAARIACAPSLPAPFEAPRRVGLSRERSRGGAGPLQARRRD